MTMTLPASRHLAKSKKRRSRRQSKQHAINIPAPALNPTGERLKRIHAAYSELTSSASSHDALELAIASVASLGVSQLDSTALIWLMIVGVPSSGKTETVLSLRGAESVLFVDTMTENALASGYVDKKGRKTPDLLQEIETKHATALVVKDLTSLFSLRDENVKKILGDLQSVYDGEFVKATGTVGVQKYTTRFSLLACVTPAALDKHHSYMGRIGSRFLFYRLPSLTPRERADGFTVSWKSVDRRATLTEFRNLVAEHVRELVHSPVQMRPETDDQQELLERLAGMLAAGRADIQRRKVETSGGSWSSEIDDVQIEEPWRALQQLRNLARALARIHGRNCVTEHELELLRRVVLSSMPLGWVQVLECFQGSSEGLRRQQIETEIGKSYGRLKQLLDELVRVKLIRESQETNGLLYSPAEEFEDLLRRRVESIDHVIDLGPSVTQKSAQ